MLRSNIFYKIFKHKRNIHHEIVKYNSNTNVNLGNQIHLQIIDIDREISKNSKALIEAQIVKFRSTFSKSNNFIEKIGKNIYKVKLEDSITWYQNELKELIVRRKKLQIDLEKHQGVFWLNRIKRFLTIILISFFILLTIFIFLSGFMIIIYLLPIISLALLVYLIATKKY